MTDKQNLTTAEAAEYFGVTRATIGIWLNEGILKGFKIGKGKYWRIPLDEVERLAREKFGDGTS